MALDVMPEEERYFALIHALVDTVEVEGYQLEFDELRQVLREHGFELTDLED